ncbi:hypothetical protein GCM10023168_03760 [Fodinibacter luteus]|uniref:Histidine kinase/HSP90-like ATPase domain-containing protein n=1 Tax=Fodinibacter luteus TaxID=552064 RepID=A0ABP8JZG5_9MICO
MEPGPVERLVLPSDPRAAFHARRHVEAVCQGLPADTVDVARLLVTELVSNAVLHADGAVLMTVARTPDGLKVEVYDESPRLPTVLHAQPPAEHGNGLRLVDALATSWGTAPRDDARRGKRVWFVLGRARGGREYVPRDQGGPAGAAGSEMCG